MAKVIYTGVSSKARKIKACYIGVSNKARKIKKAYVGVNNTARLCYTLDPYGIGYHIEVIPASYPNNSSNYGVYVYDPNGNLLLKETKTNNNQDISSMGYLALKIAGAYNLEMYNYLGNAIYGYNLNMVAVTSIDGYLGAGYYFSFTNQTRGDSIFRYGFYTSSPQFSLGGERAGYIGSYNGSDISYTVAQNTGIYTKLILRRIA